LCVATQRSLYLLYVPDAHPRRHIKLAHIAKNVFPNYFPTYVCTFRRKDKAPQFCEHAEANSASHYTLFCSPNFFLALARVKNFLHFQVL